VAFELIKHNPEILADYYEYLSPEQYTEAVEMLIEKSPQSIAQYERSSETPFGELIKAISGDYGTDLSGLSDKYDKIKGITPALASDTSISDYQTAELADKNVTQFAIDADTGQLIVDGIVQTTTEFPPLSQLEAQVRESAAAALESVEQSSSRDGYLKSAKGKTQ
jgi:transcriptional regulator with XRE-family HTH domain